MVKKWEGLLFRVAEHQKVEKHRWKQEQTFHETPKSSRSLSFAETRNQWTVDNDWDGEERMVAIYMGCRCVKLNNWVDIQIVEDRETRSSKTSYDEEFAFCSAALNRWASCSWMTPSHFADLV